MSCVAMKTTQLNQFHCHVAYLRCLALADYSDNDESKFKSCARPRDESPNSKKNRKKAIKEANAEKRKVKTPKNVKKRKEKMHLK